MVPVTSRTNGAAPDGRCADRDRLQDALVDACGCGLGGPVGLSDVAFVDARTLAVLLATSQRLVAGGCSLSIVGSSPKVRRVFQLTGPKDLLAATSRRRRGLNLGRRAASPASRQPAGRATTTLATAPSG
jgi:anti-anti-sigma factor